MSPEDPTPKIASWQADEPETLAETKVFSLHRKWAISSNDPSRCGEFVYLDVPDWVNVIALTADDRVVASASPEPVAEKVPGPDNPLGDQDGQPTKKPSRSVLSLITRTLSRPSRPMT